MALVFLGVGSNIAPERNIPAALQILRERRITIFATSRFYRTAAIGRPDQESYANGVWRARTELPPRGLRILLRETEDRLGRVRTEDKFSARTIDLDILLYDELEVHEEDLQLPDPHILERAFLAKCLIELEPGLHLPGSKMDLREAAEAGGPFEEYLGLTETIRTLLEKKR
ncbi:MAG TPA: 2-amino-4-hydroxy-6-hydroxymethyldihydropteridine diphosphokinase [Spirochaetia bacterium]|nr:2-amino-4-hydroxy-6-hydroxymethyldihydropteridine diphosphokinase [Spirochaetia bacterium]